MTNKEIQNLMEFFLEPDIDDEEVINEFIEKSEIDMERLNNKIFELLKYYQAEEKLLNGKEFKQLYLEEIQSKSTEQENGISVNTLKLAARKQTDVFSTEEQKDILSDEEKLKIIKKIRDDNR